MKAMQRIAALAMAAIGMSATQESHAHTNVRPQHMGEMSLRSYFGNAEYHPRKHPKQSYAAQNRAAKARKRARQ